jgi:hypothetical protein
VKITPWTAAKVAEFAAWHEQRMQENGYGKAVVDELRAARERFLVGVVPSIHPEEKL